MKALLMGYGEVGQSVYKAFCMDHKISIYDPVKGYFLTEKEQKETIFDILLIAFPYSINFIDIVGRYQKKYNVPVLVFSSVAIGTCSELDRQYKEIQKNKQETENIDVDGEEVSVKHVFVSHFPIEGKHPNLDDFITNGFHLVGGYNRVVDTFLEKVSVEFLEKSEWTEFLKLRSTTLYGLNIEFARYTREVAKELKLDWEYVLEYDKIYNSFYKNKGFSKFSRYLLEPPDGVLGGHCVLPNAKLLFKQYPHELVKAVFTPSDALLEKEHLEEYGATLNNEQIDMEEVHKDENQEYTYIESSLESTNESKPYLCPVCQGKGKVSTGFYSTNSFGGSSVSSCEESCRSCNNGIVWG